MRALVTGATGFMGSHLLRELLRQGWDAVCAVRGEPPFVHPKVTWVTLDLLYPDAFRLERETVGHIDVVFHLGAALPTSVPSQDLNVYIRANALSTIRLLELSSVWEVQSFVYASGLAVIGEPTDLPITEEHPLHPFHPYLVSKLYGELACELARRTERRAITCLRITSPYGPGMPTVTVLPGFVRQALESKDITWFGSGQRTQNFIHVYDVVRACLLATETHHPGVYNIGGARSISMSELAEMVIRLTPGTRSHACAAKMPDMQDDFRWEVDLRKAEAAFGYRPAISLEQGLSEYIELTRLGHAGHRLWSA